MADPTPLLDPSFIRRLAHLRLIVRRRFAGVSAGTRRAKGHGLSAELADHRPYDQGDDIRRIDWNAYARLEELVLRLYVAEQDLSVYFLLDRSASLGANPVQPSDAQLGDNNNSDTQPSDNNNSDRTSPQPTGTARSSSMSKLDIAKRIAAGIGYIALTSNERVAVSPFGAGIDAPFLAVRGRRRVGAFLRYLDRLTPRGQTDLYRSVESFLGRRPKPGLVFVLSDFLDPKGYQRGIDRLIAAHHEPVLIQILSRDDVSPEVGDDVTLVDSETGEQLHVSLDTATLAAYRKRLTRFAMEIQSYARRRGVYYSLFVPDERSIEELITRYLQGRTTSGADEILERSARLHTDIRRLG